MEGMDLEVLIVSIVLFIAFVIPGALTVWNLYNCCTKNPRRPKLSISLTVLVGAFLYMVLYVFQFEEAGDWYEQINEIQVHYSISSQYRLSISIIFLVGIIALFILLFINSDKLPPLVSVICVAALIMLNVLQIVFAVQIWKNVSGISLLFYVYHANILIISAFVLRKQIIEQVKTSQIGEEDLCKHKKFKWLYHKMSSISEYALYVFLCLFFLIALLEIVFVLCGQGIDAPIKAFTDTADWTFSKQIPPPPLEYSGHYLCTVAAAGHVNVVKPLRLGTRRNTTIIVNRQLCIANAFEEYIQEKWPAFHRVVRRFYDNYGYPISKHITTPLKADIVYIIMKPLEWIFLILLYLVDLHPEQRIRRQYKLKSF